VERARSHPALWCILMLPFGISSGFVTIALAAQGKHAGISVEAVGALAAPTVLPHTWKFLWAPIADLTLHTRRWDLLSNLVASLGIASFALLPISQSTLGLLSVVVFLQSLSTTTLGMAVEALMAHTVPRDELGRASGWFQAGNLGGSGLGRGRGLILIASTNPTVATLIVAGISLACTIAVFRVHDVPAVASERGPIAAVITALRDLWEVIRTQPGTAALLICFLPIGSGGASMLFAAIAKDWEASESMVALSNGMLGGVIAAVGCFGGGWISDKMGRKRAYAAAGVLLSVVALAMAVAPRIPSTYLVFTLAYSFANGVCYGAFTGLVLDTIGAGAAATKYNAYASLSNTPIYYMARIDGAAYTRWGASGLLVADAAAGLIGILLFGVFVVVVTVIVRRRRGAEALPARATVVRDGGGAPPPA